MSIQKPIKIPGRRKVITKNMILRAQDNTNSNMAAARWLEVTYNTYKKWAKYYKVFKKRLIEDGYFNEECSNCAYSEENIQSGEVCLGVDFEDGNHDNFKIDNLRLLCPNCYLSFNGRFSSSKMFCK